MIDYFSFEDSSFNLTRSILINIYMMNAVKRRKLLMILFLYKYESITMRSIYYYYRKRNGNKHLQVSFVGQVFTFPEMLDCLQDYLPCKLAEWARVQAIKTITANVIGLSSL